MILKIIHPMLIAMNIWQNSKVVLLRSKKLFGFSPSYSHYNQSAEKKRNRGRKMDQKKPKKKKRRVWLIVLLCILGLLVLAVSAAGLYYNTLLERLDLVSSSQSETEYQGPAESIVPIISDDVERIESGNKAEGEVYADKRIMNVLLIGSDLRIPNTKDRGRGDVTMLVSLNKETGEVKLISFERGIMVECPGVGIDLLTHSFSYGGAEVTTDIIADYFLLDIAGYAHVDFDSFSAIVDAIGGVDIELDGMEAWALKKPDAGVYHMDGADALAYCRLRSIDSNWGRIARQRKTVQAMIDRVSTMSLPEINELTKVVLPLVHTNLTKTEITTILINAPKFLGAHAEQMAVPDHNDQNCDFQYESERLRLFIYGEDKYDES